MSNSEVLIKVAGSLAVIPKRKLDQASHSSGSDQTQGDTG